MLNLISVVLIAVLENESVLVFFEHLVHTKDTLKSVYTCNKMSANTINDLQHTRMLSDSVCNMILEQGSWFQYNVTRVFV